MNNLNLNISVKDIKSIVEFAMQNSCNRFDRQELLKDIRKFNDELYSIEEFVNTFTDTHFEETSFFDLESVLDNINLLMAEYIGFSSGIVYVKENEATVELEVACNETIRICELLVRHYTDMLTSFESCSNANDIVCGNIKNQLDFFGNVILSISNMNFNYTIDERTDLRYLHIDIRKKCIILLNEKYGIMIQDENIFEHNNTISKVYKYVKNVANKQERIV